MASTTIGTAVTSACGGGELVCRAVSAPSGHATLYLSGDLDLTGSPELARRAAAALRDPPPELVLDLAGLGFVDVSGLNALLGVRRLGEQRGCSVVLRSAPRHVLRLFELADLDDLLV